MLSVAIGVAVILIILYCIVAPQEQMANTKKSVPKKFQKTSPTDKDDDASKWEVVNRKTPRWAELGFGDGGLFPGYGKLYDREFKVWYCNIGSKEEKCEQIIYDRFPLHYDPKNSERITGDGVYLNRLDNTKGYESLYTGLDNKNRKRWYFALINYTPTWIETARAFEEEPKEEIINEIEVPDGWQLVRNHSSKWIELGYDDGFPGYGEIYEVSFEVWHSIVNSKEEKKQPDISVHLALSGADFNIYYFERVCKKIEGLNDKKLSFNRLLKTRGYMQLYSGLDTSTKTRWHVGMREKRPTYFYATSAE